MMSDYSYKVLEKYFEKLNAKVETMHAAYQRPYLRLMCEKEDELRDLSGSYGSENLQKMNALMEEREQLFDDFKKYSSLKFFDKLAEMRYERDSIKRDLDSHNYFKNFKTQKDNDDNI